jgi:hypothetical protein
MASKQTRRSISVSTSCYERLKARCDKDGTSMSGVVEELIRAAVGLPPRDLSPRPAIKAPKRPVVLVTKELGPETDWKPAPGPAERIETIRKVVEISKPAHELTPEFVKASKIFTF